jgi:phospholipase D1/2
MCVIDETIGFMGGLDLCFGRFVLFPCVALLPLTLLYRRWDTPGHVLIDDGPNPFSDSDPQNADRDQSKPTQIWPGKDYSNQRVLDFHTLNKPEEDMYDRGKVPRQPWCVLRGSRCVSLSL